MKKIFVCLATHYLWLFEERGFRIIDSLWEPGFGGQGMIELSNSILNIRFLTDRDNVYAEFRPTTSDWPKDEFVTVDLLYCRISGSNIDTAMVNQSTTDFLKSRWNEIQTLFKSENEKVLLTEFRKLKNARAKRLFS